MNNIRCRPNQRRGTILVVILVCFIVAAVVIGLLVKSAAVEHKTAVAHLRSLQAQWLAEAAVQRAAARLVADANYAGETWTIPAEELDGNGGVARIRVEAVADKPGAHRVSIEADYPDDPQHRSRCTKQIEMH
jgi:type II secretory pathway component PulK